MTTIKINRSGTSQSVQLPDGFQFDVDEVKIPRRGGEVILCKKQANLREAFDQAKKRIPILFVEATAITRLSPEASEERTRIWNECFYPPLLVLAALLLPNFRGRRRMW